MSWFPICSRQVKKIRKIMFLCIGGGLLLTLGYDLLELFCAFIPGEIHIYSCGDVDFREPLEISVKAISSSSDKYAVTRSLPFAIYADSVSPLLLHKRGKKVFYSVRISAEKRQVVIVHKFLTFFWGFTGPSVYEITDAVGKRRFCSAAMEAMKKRE